MKKKSRIVCAVIAGLLAALFIGGILFSAVAWAAATPEKSETVYITADAQGTVQSILSSIYVTNPEKQQTVADETTLTDVRNVGGSEAPTVEGNRYTFQANGEDVYYQGASGETPPISMQVSYSLNGRPITPQALAGQSGRVTIRVEYQNLHTQKTTVKGEELTLYTPFTVVTMLNLDESYENITVENAKTMTEAGATTITAVTFPGLAANIEAEPEDRLAEYFTVEADVTSFEMDGITAIALTGIVDAEDIRDLDDMQELVDGVDEMSDAGDDLYSGARKLYNGAQEFDDGLTEYLDGVDELLGGVEEATDGTWELYEGSEEFSDGMGELFEGIDTLYKEVNNASVGGGTVDVPDVSLSGSEIAALAAAVESALGDTPGADAIAQGVAQALAGQIEGMVNQAVKQTANQVAQQAAAAVEGQMEDLADGIYALRNGAKELKNGAEELNDGVKSLHGGLVEIENGVYTLSEEGKNLKDGSEELVDGLNKLRKGVKELNEEGLKELASNTADITVALDRRDAMVDLGQQYKSFSGIAQGMNGTVKFVFETESVFVEKPLETPAQQEQQEQLPVQEEKGFFQRVWDWIVNLFNG